MTETSFADQAASMFTPEIRANPYPFYAMLREADPVMRSPLGPWLLFRHADCVQVLRDPLWSVRHTGSPDAEYRTESPGPGERGLDNVMLFIDPPDHTRLRKLVNTAFTPRHVESLRPRIVEITEGLLDDIDPAQPVDLLAALAYPLPVMVIAEMLGIPLEDRDRIKVWSRDIAPILDPVIPVETQIRVGEAAMKLAGYFTELIEDRRRALRHDMLSELIRAEDEGDKLTEDELRATCILLLIAGHETTMNLIGNGVLALLRNRSQLDRLIADPSLVRSAVEELLRYDGPVHLTARTASRATRVGDKDISQGEMVVAMLGAANRDPERFDDPETLDVSRSNNKHIAFSAGAHFCVGAPLARLEAQVALPRLLARFPNIELAEEPEYRDTITLRGLTALPVTL